MKNKKEIQERIEYFKRSLRAYISNNLDELDSIPVIVWNNLIDNLEWVLGNADLQENEWSVFGLNNNK